MQVQRVKVISIEEKLDKIKVLMEEVLMELKENEDAYPQESMIKVNAIKRLSKMAEEIATGKRKTVKFKSIQDLDRIVSSYGT